MDQQEVVMEVDTGASLSLINEDIHYAVWGRTDPPYKRQQYTFEHTQRKKFLLWAHVW